MKTTFLLAALTISFLSCDKKPERSGAVAAAAPGAAAPAKLTTQAKLLGAWRQETEIGESEQKPVEKRSTMTITEKTMTSVYPLSEGKPMVSQWAIKSETPNGAVLKMTMELGGEQMEVDDQTIRFIDADRIEMKNTPNSGGTYVRIDAVKPHP